MFGLTWWSGMALCAAGGALVTTDAVSGAMLVVAGCLAAIGACRS